MKYLFYIICFLIHFSCIRSHQDIIDGMTMSYKKNIEALNLPNELIDHFPNKISNYTYFNSQRVLKETSSLYCLFFEYDVNIEKIDSLNNLMRANNILEHNSMDSSLIIIKQNRTIVKFNINKQNHNLMSNDKIFPLPYFPKRGIPLKSPYPKAENIYSNSPCGLSEDFSIYIIDCKPYRIKSTLEAIESMPSKWGNGYSKGICINKNEKVVIYWIVVW